MQASSLSLAMMAHAVFRAASLNCLADRALWNQGHVPWFDSTSILPYNETMKAAALRLSLEETLLERQLAEAGWSCGPWSPQPALEPTCLALLALRSDSAPARTRGLQFLLRTQNPNGSWPAFSGDDQEGCGLTALAVIVLNNYGEVAPHAVRGLRWLLSSKGKESHWLWRWKFKTSDTHARFDPNKFGWPWMPDTCSWVIPTAFAVIALKQSLRCWKTDQVRFRIQRGVEMLLDRVCPGGGWNAGNGVVYGAPLAPHIDATAIALLALRGERTSGTMGASLDWLERRARICSAPWSLAWSILAFEAHARPIGELLGRLAGLEDRYRVQNSATLAAVILACDCQVRGNVFKVPS